MDGASLSCRGCGVEFHVCRPCWRVQRYCGQPCSKLARRNSHRQSQKKYSKTPKGRQANRDKQKRYRKIHLRQKNSETDHTTEIVKAAIKERHQGNRCHFCGAKVLHFTRITSVFSFRRKFDAHA
jgi:hypothetical protein